MKVLGYLIVSTLLLSACSSVRILSEYDRTSSFGDYTTFNLADPELWEGKEPLINELNRNGMRKMCEKYPYVVGNNQRIFVSR